MRIMLHHIGWGDGGEWDKTYACFDRARGGVLATLKKRFDSGLQDWTGWLEQLSKIHAEAKRKPATVRQVGFAPRVR